VKYPHTITRVRADLVAGVHGRLRDWDSAERMDYTDVQVQPTSSDDLPDGNREGVLAAWRVYGRPGTVVDIVSSDRIECPAVFAGQATVAGITSLCYSPVTGAYHHFELWIKQVSG